MIDVTRGDKPNITKFVTEYIEFGSGYTLDMYSKFSDYDMRYYVYQMARAVHHTHSVGVIHRDIKLDNDLVADGQAMVGDFGVAVAILIARACLQ